MHFKQIVNATTISYIHYPLKESFIVHTMDLKA